MLSTPHPNKCDYSLRCRLTQCRDLKSITCHIAVVALSRAQLWPNMVRIYEAPRVYICIGKVLPISWLILTNPLSCTPNWRVAAVALSSAQLCILAQGLWFPHIKKLLQTYGFANTWRITNREFVKLLSCDTLTIKKITNSQFHRKNSGFPSGNVARFVGKFLVLDPTWIKRAKQFCWKISFCGDIWIFFW